MILNIPIANLGCARLNDGAAKAHDNTTTDNETEGIVVGSRGRDDGTEQDCYRAGHRTPKLG